MKKILWFFVAALFLAACTTVPSAEFSGDLQVGELVNGSLELESPDTFFFDFVADTYIYGVCNQLSAIKEDVYKGNVFFIGELAFLRDRAGRVTGFEASNGRTKGIGFERM